MPFFNTIDIILVILCR